MAAKYKITENGNYLFDDENDNLSISLKAIDFTGDITGESEFLNKFLVKATSFNGDLTSGDEADIYKLVTGQFVGSVFAGDGNDKISLKLKDDNDIYVDLGAGSDLFSYKGGLRNEIDLDTGDDGLKNIKLTLNQSDFTALMGNADHLLNIKAQDSSLDLDSDGDGNHVIKLGLKGSDADIQLGAGNHNVNAKLDNSIFDFSSVDQGADVESSYLLKVSANNNSEFNSGDLDDGNVIGQGKASKNSDINFSAGAGDHQLKLQASNDSNIGYTQVRGDENQLTNLNVKLSKNSHADITQTSDAQLILNASIKDGHLDVDSGSADDQIILKGKGILLDVDTGAGDDVINLNGTVSGSVDGGEGQDTVFLKGSLDLRGESLKNLEVINFSSSKSIVYLDENSLNGYFLATGNGTLNLEGTDWRIVDVEDHRMVYTENGQITLSHEVDINNPNGYLPSAVELDQRVYRLPERIIPLSSESDVNGFLDQSLSEPRVVYNEETSSFEFVDVLEDNYDYLYTDISVADIRIIDDDTGNNILSLSGVDAEKFKIIDDRLYLIGNADLDFETKSQLFVNVEVNDPNGGGDVDASQSLSLDIIDLDEAPTELIVHNFVDALDENISTEENILIGQVEVVDDALGVNSVGLSGDDDYFFEFYDNQIFLKQDTNLDYEQKNVYNFSVIVEDTDLVQNLSLVINDVDEVPSALTLENTLTSLDENTDTTSRIKVADIAITDDALGTNIISLSGADASSFEVDGIELFLMSGVNLDFETKNLYATVVSVDGTDLSVDFNFNLNDIDDMPIAIDLENYILAIQENIDTSSRIHAAEVIITDLDEGPSSISLSGDDADLFELDGTDLYIKAGVELDFEAQTSVSVNLSVDSTSLIKNLEFDVIDVNEAPTAITLENVLSSINENSDTTSRIKVADIAIADDALGMNIISLTGDDADLFELDGDEIFLKSGVELDYEAKDTYQLFVEVNDSSINSSDHILRELTLEVNNQIEFGAYANDFLISQAYEDQYSPDLTSVNGGGFLAIWKTHENRGYDIHASLYDGNTTTLEGKENFFINVSQYHDDPKVVSLANGNFVVTWEKYLYGIGTRIYASIYDINGQPLLDKQNFKVSGAAYGEHDSDHDIANLEGGGFVVTWEHYENGNQDGVYGRVYDEHGDYLQGSQKFQIDSNGDFRDLKTTGLTDGGFVITWVSNENGELILLSSIYDNKGEVVNGKEKIPVSRVLNHQSSYDIISLPEGGFVITWLTDENGSRHVHGSVYDNDGEVVLGKENFVINNQFLTFNSELAATSNGQFLVTWESWGELYGTVFNSNGEIVDGRDSFLIGDLLPVGADSSLIALDDNEFVIVWVDEDDFSKNLLGSRFDVNGQVVNNLSIREQDLVMDDLNELHGVIHTSDGEFNYSIGDEVGKFGSLTLEDDGTFTFLPNIEIINKLPAGEFKQVFNIQAEASGEIYGYDLSITIHGYDDGEFDLSSEGRVSNNHDLSNLSEGGFVSTWLTVENDERVLRGGIYDEHFDEIPNKGDFQINFGQTNWDTSKVSGLTGGGFVVIWVEDEVDGENVIGNLYDSNGSLISGKEKFTISSSINDQNSPQVSSLEEGGFVVVWSTNENTTYDIHGSVYDEYGEVVEEQENFLISSGDSAKYDPIVAGLGGGGFVVGWNQYDNEVREIYGSLYDESGLVVEGKENFLISSGDEGGYPLDIIGLEGGGFVVVWDDSDNRQHYYSLYDQNGDILYDKSSVQIGDESWGMEGGSVTSLVNGGFVVTWQNYNAGGRNISGSLYDDQGNVVPEKENFVISDLTEEQHYSKVAKLTDGGFVVTFRTEEHEVRDIHAKRYDANANEISESEQSGNDIIEETISGSQFNDYSYDNILNIGNNDSAYGYGGNDNLEIVSGDFSLVDGGSGHNDRLSLDGINLDFASDLTLLDRVSGIEQIDLASDVNANNLTLDLSSVQALTSDSRDVTDDVVSGISADDATSDLLRISGDSNDSVSADGFSDSGTDVTVNGVDYDLYRHDTQTDAAFLLEQGVLFA